MKRVCVVLLLALVLTGCKTAYEIRPDTIVDIPLRPTQPPTEPTADVTEVQTEPVTRPPAPEVPTPGGEDPTVSEPPSVDHGRLSRAVADAVNARRQEAGAAPLVLDPRLCAAAAVRAGECAGCWAHVRPDGRDWSTVLPEYGCSASDAAELLWSGAGEAEDIVGKWMRAESSLQKLLMGAASVGVGVHTAGGVTYVAVLIVK